MIIPWIPTLKLTEMQSREVFMPDFKYLNTLQSHFWTGDHITTTLIRDFLSKEVFYTPSSVF